MDVYIKKGEEIRGRLFLSVRFRILKGRKYKITSGLCNAKISFIILSSECVSFTMLDVSFNYGLQST